MSAFCHFPFCRGTIDCVILTPDHLVVTMECPDAWVSVDSPEEWDLGVWLAIGCTSDVQVVGPLLSDGLLYASAVSPGGVSCVSALMTGAGVRV